MKNKKQNIILLSIILLIILFSSWAFIQWIFGLRQYYGTVAVSSSEFQSIHSWMPLVRSIIQGNFFPSEVSVNPEAKALLYYPYLSLWFYGLSIKLLGVVGTMIIGQVLFPVLSFFLLVKIFNRYLDILWSITISLIGLLAFSGWDFKSFLFGLINGNSFIELGVLQPLEIAHFPIPSLSIFLFLLLFYFSTLRVKLNVVNLSVLTSLWALHTQVHAVDALFGLVFWFTYFPIRLYRQTEGKINKKLLLKITMQFVIALIVVFPIIYAIVTQPPSMLGIGIISTDSKTTLDLYYYLAYFILPIMLIISIYIIKRVDVYEIIFKFWHIYMLMLIEIILISFGLLFSKWIVIDMVQNRIALFFLHFYYYVPIVYYATQPAANGLSFGIEAKSISKKILSKTKFKKVITYYIIIKNIISSNFP